MKIKLFEPESLFVDRQEMARATISGSEDFCGACSVETFALDKPLLYTHEDAEGFLNFVTRWKPANFWFKDNAVADFWYQKGKFGSFFELNFDNFQDTYGADAVLAFYHSGHGNMDSNGVYTASLGAGVGASNKMSLGDSQARYLFWSTCYSLRISGSHNPVRTWGGPNNGVRMIFGYETTIVDNPNYGKYFGEEWDKGNSLSSAFIEASWRISRNQTPVVTACGATETEAKNRVFNERNFDWGSVSDNWYYWTWRSAESTRSVGRSTTQLPDELMIAEFVPAEPMNRVRQMAEKLEFSTRSGVSIDERGNLSLGPKNRKLNIGRNGKLDAILARPNNRNSNPIERNRASDIASQFVQDRDLGQGVDLELTQVFQDNCGGGTQRGSGTLKEPYATETIFEYRQIINGMPSVNNDAGVVRVTIDNDGKVTSIHDSCRPIDKITTRPKVTIGAILKEEEARTRALEPTVDLEAAFRAELNRKLGRKNDGSRSLTGTNDEIKSTELGYDMENAYGRVVGQRTFEVDMGGGFRKMYQVEVPIFE